MGAEEHDVLAPMLHYRRVVNSLHRVGDLRLGKDRVIKPRQVPNRGRSLCFPWWVLRQG
jgi:hypothetical protein